MTDEDPGLLRSLANGYEFARDLPEATEMIKRIHLLEGTYESQEMLARILLLQVQPEEAAPYLEHLLVEPDETKVGFLALLVNAWQAKGMHDQALDVLNRMEPLYPAFAKGKEFKKLHKLSTKNRAKGKAVRSPLFEEPRRAGKHTAWGGGFAKFVFPALLVLGALIWMGVSWYKGEHQQFYLVSGLEKPYSVEIDKQSYTLQPGQVLPIELAEGKHELKASGLAASAGETLNLSRSFWGRVFDGNVYVINPDRVALLALTRMVYSTKHTANEKLPDPVLYSGKAFYSMERIDYPFAPFPETIDLPSSTSRAVKSRLLLMGGLSMDAYATTVRKLLGDRAFFEMVQRHLTLEPDRTDFLSLLVALQNPDETIAFLLPGLGVRPLRVE